MRPLARFLFVSAVMPLLAARAQQPAAPDRAVLVARLDSLVRDFLADAPAAGVTAAVVRGTDTLLFRAAGERDRERHLPAERGTVYRIGSITKQFTAAAILQLVEQGKIALGDPVTKYLPQYPQWSGVTIARLLNHTSGIHSYTANQAWQKTWSDELTPAQIVAFVANDTLDFPIGTKYRYNNTGYVLLGMVLEQVTGRPYGDYLRDTFFVPLGMRSATYCPSRATSDEHAAGYDLKDGRLVPAAYLSMSHPFSAGALCMSVPDYLRWQAALTGGRVVSPATYARMITPDTLLGGGKMGYGFALSPGMMGTHRLVQHGGDVHGFSVQQLWFPDDSMRVVVFANTLGSSPGILASNLAAAVFGLPMRTRPKAAPAVPLAAGARAVLVERLDSLARAFIVESHAAGATAAVVRGGDTLLLKGFGERDRERHLPATRSTVYRVGSITKQFTAAAIMQEVERGRLSLADTLGRFLPSYPRWGRVTIRQLLNHTSGIPPHSSVPWLRARPPEEILSPDSLLAFVKDAPLEFPPGTAHRYDNTGYLLLGLVLEKVTGRPHEALLRERFLVPLGMRSAHRCRPAFADGEARGYTYAAGELKPIVPTNVTVTYAGGDLCMDVPDYLRWQAALTSGRVVSPASYALMSTSDTVASGARIGYGFALRPGRLGTHPMVHHTGSVAGFAAQQLWLPDDSLRVVVFTNSRPPRPDLLAQNLAAAVLGVPLVSMAGLDEVPLAESDRSRYTGIYELVYPGNRVLAFQIATSDEGLVGGPAGQPGTPLIYLGDDTFGAELDPQWRLKIVFENGRAVKAIRLRADASIEGRRRPGS